MQKELFLDDSQGVLRAALLEDGVLCEIHSERKDQAKLTESLFYGRVQAIQPAVGAAFVDIGQEKNAFLPLDEGETLRCGAYILVQGAARQTTDSKGLRVTRRINLAGKWLVLVPGAEGVRISKKVKDEALRRELAQLGAAICPEGFGLIVRTASADVTAALLEEETQALLASWQAVQTKLSGMTKPGIVSERERLDMRLVRDLRGLSRVVTNSHAGYEALAQAQAQGRLAQETHIEYVQENAQLLFDAFGIEHQLEKALSRRVWLPCGGYLIMDACEAMTVIDVNSGKMVLGRDIEETAWRVNQEAAREIARQIRLRNVGGMILVDFIDMQEAAHRDALEGLMRQAVAGDRAPVSVLGLTRLGLMEMTRRRKDMELRKVMHMACSYCSGTGDVLAPQEVAQRALRAVRRKMRSGQRGPFVVRCSPAAAQELAALPLHEDALVYAVSMQGKHAEKFDLEQIGVMDVPPQGARALDKGI